MKWRNTVGAALHRHQSTLSSIADAGLFVIGGAMAAIAFSDATSAEFLDPAIQLTNLSELQEAQEAVLHAQSVPDSTQLQEGQGLWSAARQTYLAATQDMIEPSSQQVAGFVAEMAEQRGQSEGLVPFPQEGYHLPKPGQGYWENMHNQQLGETIDVHVAKDSATQTLIEARDSIAETARQAIANNRQENYDAIAEARVIAEDVIENYKTRLGYFLGAATIAVASATSMVKSAWNAVTRTPQQPDSFTLPAASKQEETQLYTPHTEMPEVEFPAFDEEPEMPEIMFPEDDIEADFEILPAGAELTPEVDVRIDPLTNEAHTFEQNTDQGPDYEFLAMEIEMDIPLEELAATLDIKPEEGIEHGEFVPPDEEPTSIGYEIPITGNLTEQEIRELEPVTGRFNDALELYSPDVEHGAEEFGNAYRAKISGTMRLDIEDSLVACAEEMFRLIKTRQEVTREDVHGLGVSYRRMEELVELYNAETGDNIQLALSGAERETLDTKYDRWAEIATSNGHPAKPKITRGRDVAVIYAQDSPGTTGAARDSRFEKAARLGVSWEHGSMETADELGMQTAVRQTATMIDITVETAENYHSTLQSLLMGEPF